MTLLLALFLTFPDVFTQNVFLPVKQTQFELHFDEVKFSNGAPVTDVIDFVEDRSGFVWLGSRYGLLRYDGHDFKVFSHQPKNKNSLVNNYIWSLYLCNDTLLYIGCAQGISILNLKSYRFTNFSTHDGTCPTDYVRSFCFENDKTMWVGGLKGLYRFNPRTGTFIGCNFKVPSFPKLVISNPNRVHNILQHPFKKEILLIATANGLVSYNKKLDKIDHTYQNRQLALSKPYTPMLIDKLVLDENSVWCLAWFMGMNRFDLKTEKWYNYFPRYYPTGEALGLTTMIVKNNKELWVTDRVDVQNNGLGIFNKETESLHFIKNIQTSSSARLPDKAVFLFMQRDSTLWLSYMDGKGLYRQNRKIKRFKSLDIPYKHLWVSAYHYDSVEHNYYFGLSVYSQGIGCWNPTTRKWRLIEPEKNMVLSIPGNSSDFSVNKFYKDSEGVIWIGTALNGLCYMDHNRKTVKQFVLPNGKTLPVLSPVFGLFEDSKKQLWVGTRTEGVFCLNKERNAVIHYVHNDNDTTSISSGSSFLSFEEDRYGKIWIGNRNGICVFNPETKKFSRTVFNQLRTCGINNGLSYTILKDTLGRIWTTMLDQGLVRITENPKGKFDFKIYQTENGLKNVVVNYMTRDKNGCFWIVNDGLLYFNPYNESYMVTDETNGMLQNSSVDDKIMVDDFGNLFTGDQVGVNWVNEVQYQSKNDIKKLFIEQISVNGNPIDWVSGSNQKVVLKHNQNNVTFSYTAVCFEETYQIRYRYKLANAEQNWNAPTTLLQARYMQLKPGKYRFIVQVSYKGKWLNNSAFLDIEIKQVFWKSWWFILLLVLLVVGMAFLIYNYRIKQLLKIQKLRNKIASDLHDDVGSTLSSISIMSDLLQSQLDNSPRSEQMIREIGTNAHTMLDSMDDIIWSVNPSNDKFQNLALRIREYAIPLFEMKDIRFSIVTPEAMNSLSMPMDVRRNVFLIAKEAVNNLVKYSECSEAKVEFSMQNSVLNLVVSDNGKGFDISNVKQHRNGLQSMKNRAEHIHGNLSVHSEIGKGTTVSFSVKII